MALRRTAIRRKPHKPTPVLDEYRAEYPPDEILFFTGARLTPSGFSFGCIGLWEKHEEIHHIFGGCGRRPDLRSNLIGVSSVLHYERHHGIKGMQNEITTLCLLSKWKKSQKIGNTLEFWYEDLRKAHGPCLLPIIEAVRFSDAFVESERVKLEHVIRNIESD